jgi:hypothetical protein
MAFMLEPLVAEGFKQHSQEHLKTGVSHNDGEFIVPDTSKTLLNNIEVYYENMSN